MKEFNCIARIAVLTATFAFVGIVTAGPVVVDSAGFKKCKWGPLYHEDPWSGDHITTWGVSYSF